MSKAKSDLQPCILTIGYTSILLPDITGVEAVLRLLRKGVECDDRTYKGSIETKGEAPRLELTIVAPHIQIVRLGEVKRLTAVKASVNP